MEDIRLSPASGASSGQRRPASEIRDDGEDIATYSKAKLMKLKRDAVNNKLNLSLVPNFLLYPSAVWNRKEDLMSTLSLIPEVPDSATGTMKSGGPPPQAQGQAESPTRSSTRDDLYCREIPPKPMRKAGSDIEMPSITDEKDDDNEIDEASDGRLPMWTKIVFCLPAAGFYGCKYMKLLYQPVFYAEDYPRAQLGIMAFFLVLGVLVDAFTDPWFSNLTDNHTSRYGRRKPFLLMSAVLCPITMFLIFFPPTSTTFPFWNMNAFRDPQTTAASSTGGVSGGDGVDHGEGYQDGDVNTVLTSIWFGVGHIMWKLCDTSTMIPLMSLGNELTPNYEERTLIWSMFTGIFSVGILFGILAPSLITWSPDCNETPNSGCVHYPVTGFFFAFFCISCTIVLLCMRIKERDMRLTDAYQKKKGKRELRSQRRVYLREKKIAKSKGQKLDDDVAMKANLIDDEMVEFPSVGTVPSFISCMMNGPFRLIVL